jgi:hypothetical protein
MCKSIYTYCDQFLFMIAIHFLIYHVYEKWYEDNSSSIQVYLLKNTNHYLQLPAINWETYFYCCITKHMTGCWICVIQAAIIGGFMILSNTSLNFPCSTLLECRYQQTDSHTLCEKVSQSGLNKVSGTA